MDLVWTVYGLFYRVWSLDFMVVAGAGCCQWRNLFIVLHWISCWIWSRCKGWHIHPSILHCITWSAVLWEIWIYIPLLQHASNIELLSDHQSEVQWRSLCSAGQIFVLEELSYYQQIPHKTTRYYSWKQQDHCYFCWLLSSSSRLSRIHSLTSGK